MTKTFKGGKFALFIVLIFVAIAFLSRGKILAQSYDLAITEVMYNPSGSDSNQEWIEIKNISANDLEITNDGKYKDDYKLTMRICVKKSEDKCEKDHPIYYGKESLELDKGEIIIITSDVGNFKEKYPKYDEKVLECNFSLTNDKNENYIGMFEVEQDGEDTIWLDELVYAGNWGGNDNGKTLEKKDAQKSNKKDNWAESFAVGGTPGKDYEKIDIKFSDKIYINEILPDPEGKDQEGEWIELYNGDSAEADLSGWSIKDNSDKRYFLENIKIDEGKFVVIKYEDSKLSLNNGGDKLELINPLGEKVDEVSYGKVPNSGESWARKKDGKFSWTLIATPGSENEFPIAKTYASSIRFNEILPNPEGVDKENEWIELYNESNEKINLQGWIIENGSKKKYELTGISIEGKSLVLASIKNSSFSIRNSNETLRLLDPNGKQVDEVIIIGSAKSGISYNKTQQGVWKWSRFVTPGEANVLNNSPEIRMNADKKVYKNIKAYFDASKTRDKDGDKLKFKWDFGDGHRSYLAETSHIFKEKGRYEIKLSVNDGSDEVTKMFKIEVGSFPKRDLEIVGLMPNPKGKDSDYEFVEIKNNSSKKINLKGYYLATGKDEDALVNHLITDDLEIDSDGIGKVERDVCKIVLPNKTGLVELRYPDKKVVDRVKYSKDKIEEGEKYSLVDGIWVWLSNQSNVDGQVVEKAAATTADGNVFDYNSFNIISYGELVKNENKGICECLVQMKTENWKSKNKKWLNIFNNGEKSLASLF